MLAITKSLTNAQKHKFFIVDPRTAYSDNPFTAQLRAEGGYERRRNLLEDRRREQAIQQMEKEKKKNISKINTEQYRLRMKYRHILKEKSFGDSDKTFYMHPGFRYKNNGEVKDVTDILSDAVDSKEKCETIPDPDEKDETISSSNYSDSHDGSDGETDSSADSQNSEVAMSDDLESMDGSISQQDEEDAKRKTYRIRLQNIKNAIKRARQHILSKQKDIHKRDSIEDFEDCYRKKTHAFCERFSRKCSRSSCMACEFDFKCKANTTVTLIENKSISVKPWRPAPSGVLLSNTSLTMRKSHSARSRTSTTCEKKADVDQLASRTSHSATPRLRDAAPAAPHHINPIIQRFKQREHIEASQSYSASDVKTATGDQRVVHSQPDLKKSDVPAGNAAAAASSATHTESMSKRMGRRVSTGSRSSAAKRKQTASPHSMPGADDRSTQSKIEHFLGKLPEQKPFVSTWRNSHGQLITWRASSDPAVTPATPPPPPAPVAAPQPPRKRSSSELVHHGSNLSNTQPTLNSSNFLYRNFWIFDTSRSRSPQHPTSSGTSDDATLPLGPPSNACKNDTKQHTTTESAVMKGRRRRTRRNDPNSAEEMAKCRYLRATSQNNNEFAHARTHTALA